MALRVPCPERLWRVWRCQDCGLWGKEIEGREFFEWPNGHRRMAERDGTFGTLFVAGQKIRKIKRPHRYHELRCVAGNHVPNNQVVQWRKGSWLKGRDAKLPSISSVGLSLPTEKVVLYDWE